MYTTLWACVIDSIRGQTSADLWGRETERRHVCLQNKIIIVWFSFAAGEIPHGSYSLRLLSYRCSSEFQGQTPADLESTASIAVSRIQLSQLASTKIAVPCSFTEMRHFVRTNLSVFRRQHVANSWIRHAASPLPLSPRSAAAWCKAFSTPSRSSWSTPRLEPSPCGQTSRQEPALHTY